ncbi:hypothetical protein NOR_02571 [Metarhizium rileyi]|uniref:Uncharacterized protein n=1 Tax=Metarhizium rileyi (strain RCEF 4871) TaxID=1649241 RepID=A0A167GQ65_METRR|nr:hypothetical protein NOR_02571 [Metarhizium rileyi RCEF 4871]
MSSPPRSPANDSAGSSPLEDEDEQAGGDNTITISDMEPQTQAQDNASDEQNGHLFSSTSSPSPPPADVPPFDWEHFEARYDKALQEADEEEKEILKEAEALAKYFRVWASAASAHDDGRAVKRLRTRQRFVNLAEEKMAQKQKHYEEVVRAFESALALLKST